MRIDLVITELDVGGAERCLTELAIGLNEAGDDVRVFAFGPLPTDQQSLLVDRMRAAGIPVASADSSGLATLPRCQRRLKAWLSERPADLCQTFLFHANVLGTRAARKSGVPVCVGGLRVADPNTARNFVERRVVRQMDALVCVSDSVQRFADQQLGTNATAPRTAATYVIPNGVDVPRFSTAKPVGWETLDWVANANVCLFVGRMHQQKGIELLQAEIDQLAPVGSDRKLLLIGSGPLQSEIDAWCSSIGHDRVQRLDWQPNVPEFIRGARLLVLPSRYEGMPNVVMEAMAAARPVVCSRVDGIAELLGADPNRQTFESGDHAAMANLVSRFMDDAEIANEVGSHNRDVVRTEFSIPTMIASYRDLYQQLVANQPRR